MTNTATIDPLLDIEKSRLYLSANTFYAITSFGNHLQDDRDFIDMIHENPDMKRSYLSAVNELEASIASDCPRQATQSAHDLLFMAPAESINVFKKSQLDQARHSMTYHGFGIKQPQAIETLVNYCADIRNALN